MLLGSVDCSNPYPDPWEDPKAGTLQSRTPSSELYCSGGVNYTGSG